MLLADLGADVVKVEQPGRGDGSRQWGPPFVMGESAYFLSVNRNKKSITLNLKSDKGREILRELASSFDVFMENFRPGTADRLGVDYTTLSRLNSKLVYCSISGFGQDGPYRERPSYDIVAQAMSGLMSLTGEKERPPVKVGVAISDISSGMFAAIGILAALMARERTGRGQMVDIAILDGMVSWLTYQAGNFLATGTAPEKLGSAHPTIAPYQAFRAADSYFVVAVGNDSLWTRFCEALGLRDLVIDEGFATNPARVRRREELAEILSRFFATRSRRHWIELLQAAGVPCGPVYDVRDVFSDEQVLHRRMLEKVKHPKAGLLDVIGVPIKMSATPGSISAPPPMLGEHTNEILTGLGFTQLEIDEFRRIGVV